MLKCFFKTNGEARAVPIHVPINLTNVQTESYTSNLYARYVQARRHYNGVADVGYTLRNAIKPTPRLSLGKIIDRVTVCFRMLEAHLAPATSFWIIMFGPLCLKFVNPNAFNHSTFLQNAHLAVEILSAFPAICSLLNTLKYEQLHRFVDREMLRKQPKDQRTILNLIDLLWLPVVAFCYMTLPSTVSALTRLVPNREEKYIVSEKMADE
jgi:hypothetical protein